MAGTFWGLERSVMPALLASSSSCVLWGVGLATFVVISVSPVWDVFEEVSLSWISIELASQVDSASEEIRTN